MAAASTAMQMLVNFHMSTNPSDTVISLMDCMLTMHPLPHHIAHFVVGCQHAQSFLCWQQPFSLNIIVSHDADCTFLVFGDILLHSLSSIYIVFESDAQHCSSAGSIHLTYHTWPLCFHVAMLEAWVLPSTGPFSDTALRPRCSRTMLGYAFNLANASMSGSQARVDLTSDVEICRAERPAARLRGGGPFARADKIEERYRAHG